MLFTFIGLVIFNVCVCILVYLTLHIIFSVVECYVDLDVT